MKIELGEHMTVLAVADGAEAVTFPYGTGLVLFPERGGAHPLRVMREGRALVARGFHRPGLVVATQSLSLLREIYLYTKGLDCRWYYVTADGQFKGGESLDDVADLDMLDAELEQSDRYMASFN